VKRIGRKDMMGKHEGSVKEKWVGRVDRKGR
jgi:hypothetical protein